MRRLLVFCVALLLLLTACGENKEVKKEELPEISLELLTVYHNPDIEKVSEAVSAYTMEKIGCRVRLEEVLVNQHKSVLSRMNADNSIDIIYTGVTTSPGELKNQGLLMGLKGLLEEYGQDLMNKCAPLMQSCYLGDDYYCIPQNLYPGQMQSFVYNEKLAEDYGISIPPVSGDINAFFESVLEETKKSDFPGYPSSKGDGFGISIPGVSLESFGDKINGTYGVIMGNSEDAVIVDLYETEEFYNYLKITEDWVKKGFIDPDSYYEGRPVMEDLLNEKIFCVMNYGQAVSQAANTLKGNKLSTIVLGVPVISGDNVTGSSIGITSYSKNPEMCMKFLNLIYCDAELSRMINHGIEGLHYVKKSGHIIDLPEGMSPVDAGYGSALIGIGDAKLNYMQSPASEEDYQRFDMGGTENAEKSIAFGYTFDPQSVAMQVSAVNQVIDKYKPGLICGIVDVDEIYPEFIEALKREGIDDIIRENQRQFDEYLKQTE